MKRLFLLLFSLFCLICCSDFNGREDETYISDKNENKPYMKHLSNQNVIAFAQDKNGVIWIGTSRGLNRFDGSSFLQTFSKDRNNGLCDNQITDIFRDSRDRMWVATVNGVNLFCNDNRFLNLPLNHPNRNIQGIFETSSGMMMFYSANSLLFYDEKSKSLSPFYVDDGPIPFSTYYPATDDTFWALHSDVITGYNASNGKMIGTYVLSVSSVAHTMDSNGLIWICGPQGITTFNTISRQVESYTDRISGKNGLDLSKVSRLFSITPRYLLILTESDIYIYNKEKDILTHQDEAAFPFTVPHLKNVRDIFRDINHNIWFGMEDNGFYVAKRYKDIFSSYPHLQSVLKGEPVVSLSLSSDAKTLFAMSKQSGLLLYDFSQKKLANYPDIQSQTVFCDSRDMVWVLNSSSSSVERYRFSNGKLTKEKALDLGYMISATEDKDGDIWLCGLGEQVYRYNYASASLLSYQAYADGAYTFIPKLCQLKDNCMIASGFYRSPSVMDANAEAFNPARIPTEQIDLCIKRSVMVPTDVREDSDGTVWIGTLANGLLKYDHHANHIVPVDGAPCDDVMAVEEDMDGKIWVSTMNGLGRLDKHSHEFVHFFFDEGGSNQFFERSSVCLPDGTMIFGGTHGVTVVDPHSSKDKFSVNMIFESLKVNNDYVMPSAGGPIDVILEEKPDIVLEYDQSSFEIGFAALDYTSSGRSHYYYMLEGYEQKWHDADSAPFAYYTRVKPGKYRLHVRYVDDSQNIASMEDFLNLRVKAAPWWSWWAILLYHLFFWSIVLFIYNMRHQVKVAKEEKRHLEFEKEQERKVNEMHVNFFANVAHEFRTPLTMISGPLSILSDKLQLEKSDRKLMDVMDRNVKRMMSLVNQFLDYNKLENETLKLEVSRHDICEDLRKMAEVFEVSAKIKGLYLSTEGLDDSYMMVYDQDKLHKMVSNLLTNAVKYTKEGSIKIGFYVDNGGKDAIIYVQDTGVGVPEALREKIFERYFRVEDGYNWGAGIGLYYVRSLAKAHHGTVIFEPNVVNGKESGSIFTITLPADEGVYASGDYAKGVLAQADKFPLMPQSEEAEAEEPQDGIRKILVVDDDMDICNYLKILLKGQGFSVETCFDGKTALAKIKEWEPDLVISDVVMPQMSGTELCKQIRKDLAISHIPVILVTAKTTVADHVEGLDSGADAYITKPFDPKYLFAVIKSQMDKRHSMQLALSQSTDATVVDTEETLSLQDKAFLAELYRVMEESLADIELDINFFANTLHISRTKLYYKVKGLTGESPAAFFKNFKLNKAAEMITSGKYNVSEISDKTGFASLSHFSTSFKKHFGMTPSEYAKNKK